MKKIAVVLAAGLIGMSASYSQKVRLPDDNGVVSKPQKSYAQHRFHLYYGMGYANDMYTRINNEFIHNNFSCSQSLEARYAFFFARQWGVSVGAGVSQFFGKGTLNIMGVIPHYNDFGFDPSGQHDYDLHYETHNLVEQQRIWALEVPLQFHFEYRKGRRPGVSASLGARGYFPIISAQSIFPQDKGVLTTYGYESFTNTVYDDPPHFGKQETRLIPSTVKLRPSVDITADIGMLFRLGCAYDFYLGVYGSYGFMNILPDDADKKDVITSEPVSPYTVNSLLGTNFISEYNHYIENNNLDWKKADEQWKRWQVGMKIGIHIKPHDKCKEKHKRMPRERFSDYANSAPKSTGSTQTTIIYRDTVYIYNIVPSNYMGDNDLTQSEKESIYKLVNLLGDAKILFDLDSDIPKIDNNSFIAEVSKILQKEHSLNLIIEGYTCDLGSDEHNRDLAARRAVAIRNLFIQQGTNSSQIQTAGYTYKDPESQLNIQEGTREEHRAVIFRIYKKR